MPIVTDDVSLRRILTESRTVAVLGAKDSLGEAAYYVPAYLRARGFGVRGINPKLAGAEWLGSVAVGALADCGPVDVIEVFRRADALPDIAREVLALPWRPKVVWFQLGIRHDQAAEWLSAAGIAVVQDRCMMPDHQRLVAAR